ncbi:MAG: PTS transporter subunit EIIB [[Clostridium] innocuum]
MESFMKNQDLAKAILDHIGKEENIKNLTHCVTRLRFTLKDRKKQMSSILSSWREYWGYRNKTGSFRLL